MCLQTSTLRHGFPVCWVVLALHLLLLLAGAVVASAASLATFNEALGGPGRWPAYAASCAATTSLSAYQQSPVAHPGATPDGSTTTNYEASVSSTIGAAGLQWIPFTVSSADSGHVIEADLRASGISLTVNGEVIEARFAHVRRPAEHLPSAYAGNADLVPWSVEVQVHYGLGNRTVLATSRVYIASNTTSHAPGTIVAAPKQMKALLDTMAEAFERRPTAVLRTIHLTPFADDFGLAGGSETTYWAYDGSQTVPLCAEEHWYVDTQIYSLSAEVIGSLPLGSARPLQPLVASVASPKYVRFSDAVKKSYSAIKLQYDPAAASITALEFTIDEQKINEGTVRMVEALLFEYVTYALVAACSFMSLFCLVGCVAVQTYRPPMRSTWVHPRVKQRWFGFASSTLYKKEIAPSSDDDSLDSGSQVDYDDEEDGE